MSASKRSYFEQKEHDKLVRQARKRVEEFEKQIAELENKVAEIEATLATGNADDPNIFTEHQEANKKLEMAMSEWELASEELERISNE